MARSNSRTCGHPKFPQARPRDYGVFGVMVVVREQSRTFFGFFWAIAAAGLSTGLACGQAAVPLTGT